MKQEFVAVTLKVYKIDRDASVGAAGEKIKGFLNFSRQKKTRVLRREKTNRRRKKEEKLWFGVCEQRFLSLENDEKKTRPLRHF